MKYSFIILLFLLSLTISSLAQTAKKRPRLSKLTIGNLQGARLQIDSFKAQKELKTNDGFGIIYYNIYFSGVNFQNVQVATVAGSSFAPLISLMEKCVPGSVISFDNIIALNKAGDTGFVNGKSFTIYSGTDSIDTKKTVSETNKQLYELMKKEFTSGVIYFSGNGFTNVITVSKKDFPSLANLFARCVPGSVVTFENCIYKKPDGTLSKPLFKSIKLE
jgi:hypothetical protein